jgi:hypothetical protein
VAPRVFASMKMAGGIQHLPSFVILPIFPDGSPPLSPDELVKTPILLTLSCLAQLLLNYFTKDSFMVFQK